MLKKKPFLVIVAIIVIIGLSLFVSRTCFANTSENCAFCHQDVLNAQQIYEDDLVRVLYTHKPIFPGHCLIIPKRHVERFEILSDEEITRVGRVIKEVHRAATECFETSSYLLLQKNGREVGQSVPHVHIHYIPRKAGDSSTLKFLLRMYLANFRKPLPSYKMDEVVDRMKLTMESTRTL